MKKIVLAFIAIVSILSLVHAQSDTLYIMKAGVIIDKFDVNTQIDSVIFYNPTKDSLSTVTDFDGNVYNTVTIGTQVWMAENLKTTRYANGEPIEMISDHSDWRELGETSVAYCWYHNDIYNKDTTNGALYTWAAAMKGAASSEKNPSGIQGVCPAGWHLPSEAEWAQMINYLADNGYNYDGTTGGGGAKIAKALASTSGWVMTPDLPDYEGAVGNTDHPAYRNKSGFSALPSGCRNIRGNFTDFRRYAGWWSATNGSKSRDASIYLMYHNSRSVSHDTIDKDAGLSDKDAGLSVRCVKD
jgi:uncharacterized protein (TIGR02145 family)